MKHFVLDTSMLIGLFFDTEPFANKVATRFFLQIETGNHKADLSLLILSNLIDLLENQNELRRHDFVPELCDLISLKGIRIIELKKSDCVFVLRQYERSRFTFRQCYILWLVEQQHLAIASTVRQLTNYRSK